MPRRANAFPCVSPVSPLCPSVSPVVKIFASSSAHRKLRNHNPAPRLFRPRDDGLPLRKLRKEEIDERPRLRPARRASQAHTQDEYQRLQYIRIPQPCFSNMFPLGLPKFPDHALDFAGNRLVRQICGRLLVDEAGVHQCLVALRKRTDRRDQIAVHERAIGVGALRQREAESQNQFLAFVEKLLGNLNLGKQSLEIARAGPLILLWRVLTRLLEIRAVAWTIERHLALFPAALRADSP